MYSGSFFFRWSRNALTSGAAGGRDHIGHQPLDAGHVLARHHHRLPNGRMLAQHRFDLAQFDAEAANLHLMIDPAQILDVASRQEARQVARAIEPRAPG